MWEKNRLGVLFLVVILTVSLIGCGNTQKANNGNIDKKPSSQPVILKLGHIGALASPLHKATLKFAELVKQKTNGQVEIQVFPASQLGSELDIDQAVKAGTVDMAIPGAGDTANLLKEYNLFNTPYIFKNTAQLHQVSDGEIGKQFADKMLQTNGIRIIAQNWERGARNLIINKPVRIPADLKGLKIRVPQVPVYVEAFKAMGASPTPIAFPEAFGALQQGVVDGLECPIDFIYDNKFYEPVKYLILTGHILSVETLMINEKKFQSLTPDQQKDLVEAGKEAGD